MKAHDWAVSDVDPNHFPPPSHYHLDLGTISFGKRYVCKACGYVVMGNSDQTPMAEPGMQPCRPETYQTGDQMEAERDFLDAVTASRGLALSDGDDIPREVAVAMSALCRSSAAEILRFGERALDPDTGWSRGKVELLALLFKFVEGTAYNLQNGWDFNWHDDCCDGDCPEMDDSLHPDAMLKKVRALLDDVDKERTVSEVMGS